MKVYIIILLYIKCIHCSHYKTYDLDESNNLCEDLHKKPLRLGLNMPSAIKMLLYSRKSFHCQFEIKPKNPKHGVVAVIQDISFEKDEATGECIDYISFRGTVGQMSQKFCGTFDVQTAMEHYVIDGVSYIAMATDNTFQHDIDDVLTVVIHMNMHEREEYDYFTSGAEIVFTNFRDCDGRIPYGFKPCINLQNLCIEEQYFDDGYVNCPLRGCLDEVSCVPHTVKYFGRRMVSAVIIGFVAAVIISLSCVYFCTPDGQEGPSVANAEVCPLPCLEGDEDEKEQEPPPIYESLFPRISLFAEP